MRTAIQSRSGLPGGDASTLSLESSDLLQSRATIPAPMRTAGANSGKRERDTAGFSTALTTSTRGISTVHAPITPDARDLASAGSRRLRREKARVTAVDEINPPSNPTNPYPCRAGTRRQDKQSRARHGAERQDNECGNFRRPVGVTLGVVDTHHVGGDAERHSATDHRGARGGVSHRSEQSCTPTEQSQHEKRAKSGKPRWPGPHMNRPFTLHAHAKAHQRGNRQSNRAVELRQCSDLTVAKRAHLPEAQPGRSTERRAGPVLACSRS